MDHYLAQLMILYDFEILMYYPYVQNFQDENELNLICLQIKKIKKLTSDDNDYGDDDKQ